MEDKARGLTRREMLGMAAGIAGLGMGSSAIAQEAARFVTPEVMLGPFYPVLKPLDRDADLTMVKGHKKAATGEVIHVTGRVLNQNGQPVSGAEIEIWQANSKGRYAHPSDTNTTPLDEDFQGFAVIKTDSLGRYRFKTIKPGAYPVSPTELRTPHIHFDVKGKQNRLTSQMFFPGEPLNNKDMLYLDVQKNYPKEYTAVVASKLPPTREIAAAETLFRWDIVLING